MAHASTVSFNDGVSAVVVINAPTIQGAGEYEILPITVSEESAGRTIRSYQLTSKQVRQMVLVFNSLNQTMKDALVDFFFNLVRGPSEVFNYTHSDGTTYTNCRFANDAFPVRRTERGTYNVPVTIRFEGQTFNN